MGIFGNLSTEGLEETEDRIGGGGGFVRETDIYVGVIKLAYAGQSDGGARNVTIVFDDGKELRETTYITNRSGQNFFHPKKPNSQERDTTKKTPLPGFTTINDLCIITTDKGLAEQNTEEKAVNIWNKEAKKELPTAVPVLVDLIGKPVALAVYKVLSNKSESDGNGGYRDIAETRESNEIEKVLHPTYKVTVKEANSATKVEGDTMLNDAGENVGTFWDKWLEAHKGKTKDKRTIKDGDAGSSGRPGQNKAAPSQGGNSGAPKKSLFGG